MDTLSRSESFEFLDDTDAGAGAGGAETTQLADQHDDAPYFPDEGELELEGADTGPDGFVNADHRTPSQYDPGERGSPPSFDFSSTLPSHSQLNQQNQNANAQNQQRDVLENRLRTTDLSAAEALAELGVEDASDFIREKLSFGPDDSLCLEDIPDPPPGKRPGISLPHLAMLAIHNSPRKMLTLQEIYGVIEGRFEWYRRGSEGQKKKWQGSIRHTLSLKSIFQHKPRPITEPGKGQYWFLDPSQGDGYKRERRRKGRNAREDEDEDFSDGDRESAGSVEVGADGAGGGGGGGTGVGIGVSVGGGPVRNRRSPYSSSTSLRRLHRAQSTPQLHHSPHNQNYFPSPSLFPSDLFPSTSSHSSQYNISSSHSSYSNSMDYRSPFHPPNLPAQSISNDPAFGHPSFPIQPSLPPPRLFGASSFVAERGYGVEFGAGGGGFDGFASARGGW